MLTVIVRTVFEKDLKYYAQIFQMNACMKYKCQNMIGLISQKELILTQQIHKKSVISVIIGTFQTKIVNVDHIFAMVVMI